MTTRRTLPVALLSLALTAGTALALPPVVDRIAPGNAAVIVVPSLEKLEAGVAKIAALVTPPGEKSPSIRDMLSELPENVAAQLDQTGPLVVVMPEAPKKGKDGQEVEPKAVVLFKAKDYGQLVTALGGTAAGAGKTDEVSIDGEARFFKSVEGGLVATSDDKAMLDAMSFGAGNMGAHKAFAGPKATALSNDSELVIMLDPTKFHQAMDEGIKEMQQGMQDMAAMGGQEPNTEAVLWMVENLAKNATSTTMLLNLSDAGMGFEMVASFKPESDAGKLASIKSNAAVLMSRLPAGPYLLAGAADFASADLRALLGKMPAGKGMGAGVQNATNKLMLEKTTGSAMVVGVNPGGIMSGLLTRATTYVASTDPAGYLKAYGTDLAQAYQADKMGTMTVKNGAADVGGVMVDEYTIKMTPQEGVPPQAMQFMFGMAGGPAGYMAPAEGGVVMTLGKSSELMGAAMKAAKGEGTTLNSDKPLTMVQGNLPANRTAEMYLGTKGIIDSILPMAAMFMGTPLQVDIPADVPPIGAAIAPAGANQWQATIFVPNQVIKTGGDIAKAFEQAQKQMQGDEMPEDQPGDKPKDDKPGDKPKF
jgi:hypothetical protein